jgi:hypothetical protein
MKKPRHYETRVAPGFVGSLVGSRLADFLNIRLLLMDAIRRFAARRGSARMIENRTYVFILVPCGSRGNGHARKPELEQGLIDNSRHADDPRTNGLFSTLAAPNRAASRTTAERDLNNAPGLNHDLMWTWFLPNPLWPPNKSKFVNLFRFGLKGFNAKTRRES